ncbi:hypothetical protein HanXRQr2_Chr06g0249951 [Helianthus annuus]|uniref:Uncharacterized protein n=1 Tax=Helianthus annuus TaxID=4232 RepID=A0A9K3IRP7_HELAN|nr:hypothetical protein HanXRQr2_Chr06g0249951 [Helianthus annuus]
MTNLFYHVRVDSLNGSNPLDTFLQICWFLEVVECYRRVVSWIKVFNP